MKVAAIDIGTNTVLLLVAETRGGLHAELELATVTRLGEGVDRSRTLAAAACDRTLRCLAHYRAMLDAHAVQHLDVVGTSALRDAHGGSEFIAQAADILGVAPRVITGNEEAALTFEGALHGLRLAAQDVTVFDIGGGSTEIVVGRAQPSELRACASLDVGTVRLFERYVRSDPATPAERAAIVDEVSRALASAPRPQPRAELIGVAGTVTQLAALHFALPIYDPARVHGARLDASALRELAARLDPLTLEERRSLPGMDPERARLIQVGAFLVCQILDWSRADSLIVSDRGVRWGLAARRERRPTSP